MVLNERRGGDCRALLFSIVLPSFLRPIHVQFTCFAAEFSYFTPPTITLPSALSIRPRHPLSNFDAIANLPVGCA